VVPNDPVVLVEDQDEAGGAYFRRPVGVPLGEVESSPVWVHGDTSSAVSGDEPRHGTTYLDSAAGRPRFVGEDPEEVVVSLDCGDRCSLSRGEVAGSAARR